ncbi:MAG TPA: CHRD domain-containing protein [Thermoanaerobaculia bacterium]
MSRSIAALTLSLLVCAATSAPAQTFVFDLRASQEVPPNPSTAIGGCFGNLDQPNATFAITCVHDVAGATIMHIHRGAPGVNGPVAFDLGTPTSPVSATWTGMTTADINDLLSGNLYVNIHSGGRPSGEIRGQIVPRTVDTVPFTANGPQVVPPNSTAATATCTADLDNAAASLAISCTHDLAGATEAHVHEGPAGTNGPVVFTFPSATSPLSANVPMTPQLVADFAATFLYLEIHTTQSTDDNPSPQIRGQIGTPPAPPTTGTIRIVKSTSPAGGTGFSFSDDVPGGPAAFTLNDGAVQTFSNVAAGTYTITEGAAPNFALTDVACADGDSVGNPFARTATVSLQGGETVTCTFHNLRTFASPTIFVFDLSGAHEVPPTASAARGGCMAEFDGASTLSIVCTHDVVLATVMHIHRGAAGTNGPVAFDLGNPSSPVEATWSGMTPADVADLLAGNLYVNIHTAGRPTGEIRGQILPRTIDNFSFPLNGAQEVPPTTSTATGTCTVDLSNDASSLAVQCTHDVVAATDAHLHVAPAGEEGPVVFHFPTTSSFSASVPMTPRLVADFAAGFLYVNIHSAEAPQGEIRGQALPAFAVADIPVMSWWIAALLTMAIAAVAWLRLRG